MLGGNVMSLPEMGNFVVSVSSSGQIVEGDSSQNANAKINANYKRGKGLDINASSSAICSRHNHNRKSKNIPSKINHGCSRENLDNTQNFNAQSKVNVAMPPHKVSPIFEKNPQQSEIHVTADASAHNEGSCSNSTNAEVILRPNNIRRSRQRSVAWERTMNSKLVKTITRLSVGDFTKTYYTPLLKKNSVKVGFYYKILLILICMQFRDTKYKSMNIKILFKFSIFRYSFSFSLQLSCPFQSTGLFKYKMVLT